MRVGGAFAAIGLLFAPFLCRGDPPIIYSASAYESPVRADPDDLLLLPGYGFSEDDVVVYRAVDDASVGLTPPAVIPSASDASFGVADLVSVVDAPFSLTIHLPAAIKSGETYGLWVVNANNEWSNGIRINDARPLWITPDEVYSAATTGSLPRVLKVVGRNLQPQAGAVTRVQLLGPSASYTMSAIAHRDSNRAVDRYVAAVNLPSRLQVGTYRIRVSRDGRNWTTLPNDTNDRPQALRVLSDPPAATRFAVGRYRFGNCMPGSGDCAATSHTCAPDTDAGGDQTLCIVAAISAARSAGGGVVVFGPGIWRLGNAGTWPPGRPYSSKGVSLDGILVPEGVSLQGAGRGATRLVRSAQWDIHVPGFALLGHNSVAGFTFGDDHVYQAADQGTGFLMLGTRWDRARVYDSPLDISHVVISDDEFDKPFIAIGNGGLEIDHLILVHNVFGAFSTALTWEGYAGNLIHRYRFGDSIVAYNSFFPGSYLDLAIGQGSLASSISGGYRTDFSNNVADGTSSAYLNDKTDAKGWRAAHFWAMHDNVEMLLVSENLATCTGDKDGDGEAIAYDGNHNRPDFLSLAVPVLAARTNAMADTSTLTVRGSLIEKQISYGSSIDVRPVSDYYVGDWIQVVRGAGIGQARKITHISAESDAEGPLVSFVVFPSFDVLPDPRSLVTGGRIYWQSYTVGNTIDHRAPTCLKSNRTRPSGGLITLYAPTVDSVVEGNRQYDTSGILLAHTYQLLDPSVGIPFPNAFVQSSNEVRGNEIDGTYDDGDKPLANNGIYIGYGATPHSPPPILSYALSISHNVMIRAGAAKGAIALNQGWYTGPVSRVLRGEVTPWKVADATLIFKNALTGAGERGAARVGIGLDATSRKAPIEWRSVLYGNTCDGTFLPQSRLADFATQTIAYCPRPEMDSCECTQPPTGLVMEVDAANGITPVGSIASYAVLVANRGPSAASGVTLTAEPTGGSIEIKSMSGASAICDTEDLNVNLCRLDPMAVGAIARIDVRVAVTAIGEARTTFSVSHRGPDVKPSDDSVVVRTRGVATDAARESSAP